MKKLIIIMFVLLSQPLWSQDKPATTPEKTKTEEETKKDKELKEKLKPYIALYKVQLAAVEKSITEKTELSSDTTKTEAELKELIASISELTKKKKELSDKISKLEGSPEEKDYKEIVKAEDEAKKKDALEKKAAPFIELYETQLESLNAQITVLNKALENKTQSADAADTALASITDLVKQRNELKAKIDHLKTNPQESDFEEGDNKKNKIDVKEARYTFLNGLNFDFTNSKTNYVGHFNVYVPCNERGTKVNPWGINAGILKVNYLTRDSIVNFNEQNVLINPLDNAAAPNDSYTRQYNRYSTSTKVTSTSLYAQPMLRIWKKGAANLYVHAHFELLWSKFETGTKVNTIQSDTVTIDITHPAPSQEGLIRNLVRETHQTINITSPHFGIGGTLDFNFLDNCILFLQPTIGIAINNVNRFPTQDADGNYSLQTYKKAQGFLLVRTYFQYATSKATQIIIGTDSRGLLPSQQPYLSAYVGLNLGIDQIFQ
ncbi:hypothetical protein ACLI1A_00705 [Flavobacterium sp. RHBU_3]|uniref:hypothetical protein n=1 Tax=Flavobacterium sp. RHBU_3 TaxID=3391184 RepID=UPI0039851770